MSNTGLLGSWSFLTDYADEKSVFDAVADMVYRDLRSYYQTNHQRDPRLEECTKTLAKCLPSLSIWVRIEVKKGFAHIPPSIADNFRDEMAQYILEQNWPNLTGIGNP